MEPPFPAVATADPVREAVELLTGERQALTVTENGRPGGIVTRADLLKRSLDDERPGSPPARCTRASSPTRLVPRASSRRSTRPRPTLQPAPGEFVEDYDASRSANPTRQPCRSPPVAAAAEGLPAPTRGGR